MNERLRARRRRWIHRFVTGGKYTEAEVESLARYFNIHDRTIGHKNYSQYKTRRDPSCTAGASVI